MPKSVGRHIVVKSFHMCKRVLTRIENISRVFFGVINYSSSADDDQIIINHTFFGPEMVISAMFVREKSSACGKSYFKIPDVFIATLSVARLAALICTSGRRYSSSMRPSIASAALTGTGLVSMNKSLNSG